MGEMELPPDWSPVFDRIRRGTYTPQDTAAVMERLRCGIFPIALGERSVAVGGDVVGSTIITGDRNVVQQGKYNVHIGEAQGVAVGDRAQVTQTVVEGDICGGTVATAGREAGGRRKEVRRSEVFWENGCGF